MNILVIIHNQQGSGVYEKVVELCNAYIKSGNKVTLYCTSSTLRTRGEWKRDGALKIYTAPDLFSGRLRQGIDPWNMICRIYEIRKSEYDVVQAIDCRPVVILPALYFTHKNKVPLILSWWDLFGGGGTAIERSGKVYNLSIGRIEEYFEKVFRKYADISIAVSSLLKQKLLSLGVRGDTITVLRVGCQKDRYPSIDKYEARKTLKLPENVKIFCFTGAIFKRDLNLLLASLECLKSKIKEMPLTILIGNIEIEDAICKNLNIRKIGRVNDRKDLFLYFNASDYGLLPFMQSIANSARWPSKLSDYVAANLPVIATPFGDIPNIVKKFGLGVSSKSDAREDYAEAMYRGLLTSGDKYQTMVEGNKLFLQMELDWDVIAKRTLTNLDSLINKTRKSR